MSILLLVGGTFDDRGGKVSSVFGEFARGFADCAMLEVPNLSIDFLNGGHAEKLNDSCLFENADVVVWMAHIPVDTIRKSIHNVKRHAPHATLVMSKAVYDRDPVPSYADITQKMLAARANLLLRIDAEDFFGGGSPLPPRKVERQFSGLLIDPLGNQWGEESKDFHKLGKIAASHVYNNIRALTRVGSKSVNMDTVEVSYDFPVEFLKLVRANGEIFSTLKPRPTKVPEDEKERFFGNAAFRCDRGFPAIRQGGYIFVSRRNVEKETLGADDFVPCLPFRPYSPGVQYLGIKKPSVDTPVQLMLFDALPKINFMMHGHVYLKGAPMTSRALPCGAVEEFGEVMDAIKWDRSVRRFVVNLKGHGFIAGGASVEDLPSKPEEFEPRPVPECMW